MRQQLVLSFVLAFTTLVVAQTGRTIPELVNDAATDVSITLHSSNPRLRLDRVLAETDFVVRATIGSMTAKLSEDGRQIFTTYQLDKPQVLYASSVLQSSRPGMSAPPLVLEQRGGTVAVGQFKATEDNRDGAKLTTGMEVVVLLNERDGRYMAAAGYGVFEIRDSKIVSLFPGAAAALHEYNGTDVNAFIREMVSRRQQLTAR